MLIQVWILTLFIGSGGSVQYNFKTQAECIKAKTWYAIQTPLAKK